MLHGGAVFSFLAVSEIFCGFFGNLLYSTIYSHTLYIMGGFVYLCAALTQLIVVIILRSPVPSGYFNKKAVPMYFISVNAS